MRKKTVPVRDGERRVDRVNDGDEVIFESSNRTFSRIDTVFSWRYKLVLDLVFLKRVFELLGAFVIEDVHVRGMTLVDKDFVCGLPSVANSGSLAIWNGHCMDGVCVLMVKDKDVVVATTGWCMKFAGLIGIGF